MKSAVFGTVIQEYCIYAVPQCLFSFLHVELCSQVRDCAALLTDYQMIVRHQGTMYIVSYTFFVITMYYVHLQ